MGLVHRKTCLYCGGSNWVKDKHWMCCADCHPERAEWIRRRDFKPTLLDKGRPSRPGG